MRDRPPEPCEELDDCWLWELAARTMMVMADIPAVAWRHRPSGAPWPSIWWSP